MARKKVKDQTPEELQENNNKDTPETVQTPAEPASAPAPITPEELYKRLLKRWL